MVMGSCLFGIVLLALFVITERRIRWPLIDLALFQNRPFVMGCLSFFFFSAALLDHSPIGACSCKHVGIYPTARWARLLTGYRVDCPLYPSVRADRTKGWASAVCAPCAGSASNRVKLFLCCGYPRPHRVPMLWDCSPPFSCAVSPFPSSPLVRRSQ